MYFEEEIKMIENDDLRELTEELIKTVPQYFWTVSASSSGKFHPKFATFDGGLYRHTLMAYKILNHIFEVIPMYSCERDLMRIAVLMHDTRKSGTQEEYEADPKTKFEHPLYAANVVKEFLNKKWDNGEILMISDMIASHMGKWNTSKYSDAVLPIPETKYQKIVHVVDYLASRKDIFDDND